MMLVLTTTLLGFGSIASATTDNSQYSEKRPAGLQTRSCKASVEDRIAYRNERQNRFSELGPDARDHFNRFSSGRGKHFRMNGLEERLGLSKQQSSQVKELREKQFSLVVAERRELATLKRELEEKSFTTTPDRKKIDELSDKIGQKYASLAQLKSKHLTELVSILTPAQRTKLQTIRDARELRQHRDRF
ncbi:MAG: periplasmic heavy metal sensor [Chlorobiaceae bacterium]|nr:periplasmic heavy metal sensor [Chlorobiaceae bacterium]